MELTAATGSGGWDTQSSPLWSKRCVLLLANGNLISVKPQTFSVTLLGKAAVTALKVWPAANDRRDAAAGVFCSLFRIRRTRVCFLAQRLDICPVR